LNGGNDIDTVPCNDKRKTMERARERGEGGAEKAVLVSSPPSK
jgi:hypothetical protein